MKTAFSGIKAVAPANNDQGVSQRAAIAHTGEEWSSLVSVDVALKDHFVILFNTRVDVRGHGEFNSGTFSEMRFASPQLPHYLLLHG